MQSRNESSRLRLMEHNLCKKAKCNELHYLYRRPHRHCHGHPVVYRSCLRVPKQEQQQEHQEAPTMTIDAPAGVVVAQTTSRDRDQSSYVDWPAIIAGIILASAISVVLISFGSAVGLNFLDFGYGDGPNPIFVGIAAATWFLWVQVSSFMAGGYLTGRLRRRYFDASEDES